MNPKLKISAINQLICVANVDIKKCMCLKDHLEHDNNSNKRRLCGKCVADFVLPFVLLPTVTNRVICLYLIEIAGLNEPRWKGYGAGEGIRTLDPNLGKVVLYH